MKQSDSSSISILPPLPAFAVALSTAWMVHAGATFAHQAVDWPSAMQKTGAIIQESAKPVFGAALLVAGMYIYYQRAPSAHLS